MCLTQKTLSVSTKNQHFLQSPSSRYHQCILYSYPCNCSSAFKNYLLFVDCFFFFVMNYLYLLRDLNSRTGLNFLHRCHCVYGLFIDGRDPFISIDFRVSHFSSENHLKTFRRTFPFKIPSYVTIFRVKTYFLSPSHLRLTVRNSPQKIFIVALIVQVNRIIV